jgi:hypothetical protein
VAYQDAGECAEAEMYVGSAFVAGAEAFVLVEPGEAAFDDPAVCAETAAGCGQRGTKSQEAEAVATAVIGLVVPLKSWSIRLNR